MITRALSRLKPVRTLSAPHPATWLALVVPIFAWAQLAYPGYFELHSGFLPIFNLNDLLHHLGELTWAPAIGQTYDLLRGEGVLPYRLAAAASFLGVPAVPAVKWIFGASMFAGAVGMFGWARRRLGSWPALLAETVYLAWPIALATVYVRGAFAEAALLGLLPWVLWAADAAVLPGRKRSGVALALTLAAALWIQAGLALWLAMIVLVYILVLGYAGVSPNLRARAFRRSIGNVDHQRPAEASNPTKALPAAALLGWVMGILLGTLGLLPLLLGRGIGGGAPVAFADHLVYPHQLLLSGWGIGPSIPGPDDSLPFDLGVVAFCLAVLSVLPLADMAPAKAAGGRDVSLGPPTPRRSATILASRMAIRRTQYVAAAVVLLTVFLSTTLAAGMWRWLPGLAAGLTYPWQLLLLAAPWLAWLAGAGGRILAGLFSREPGTPSNAHGELLSLSLFAGLITLVLISSYTNLNPAALASPAAESPVAIFGAPHNEIALLQATVSGTPGPDGRVVVSAQWQALRPLDSDYTIFVHAVTPDGTRWAQVDTMPQGGKLPTSQWRPGQVVTDRYALTFESGAPAAQEYRYLLGLYLGQTGQRLPAGTVEDPRQRDDKVVVRP